MFKNRRIKYRKRGIIKFIKNKPFTKLANKDKKSNYIVEGASGKEVEKLQTMLLELSHVLPSLPVVTIDGYYGNETKKIIKEFQSLNSLPTTGDVDELTLDKIKEFLDNK